MLIDAGILCGITALMAMNGTFGGDEAAKYIDPKVLFWLKSVAGWGALTLQVLKSFRSTSFAHNQDIKDAENITGQPGQTEIKTQISQPPPVVTTQVVSNPTEPVQSTPPTP